jgi:hypothetical protein
MSAMEVIRCALPIRTIFRSSQYQPMKTSVGPR